MSYDLRDVEGEVRRLADAIGNIVRQIQTERREHALDVAAARVTAERVATALEKLVEIADSGGMRGGGGIMESALGASLGGVMAKILSKPSNAKFECDDPDCEEHNPKKSDAAPDAPGEEPINGKGEELAK